EVRGVVGAGIHHDDTLAGRPDDEGVRALERHRAGVRRQYARHERGPAVGRGARGSFAHRDETLPKRRAIGASTRGRAAIQAAAMTTSDATKNQNPVQFSAYAAGSVEP